MIVQDLDTPSIHVEHVLISELVNNGYAHICSKRCSQLLGAPGHCEAVVERATTLSGVVWPLVNLMGAKTTSVLRLLRGSVPKCDEQHHGRQHEHLQFASVPVEPRSDQKVINMVERLTMIWPNVSATKY